MTTWCRIYTCGSPAMKGSEFCSAHGFAGGNAETDVPAPAVGASVVRVRRLPNDKIAAAARAGRLRLCRVQLDGDGNAYVAALVADAKEAADRFSFGTARPMDTPPSDGRA